MMSAVMDETVAGLKDAEVSFCSYVPDTWMAPLIGRLEDDASFEVLPAVNEGEGVAMCAGAWLGGRRAVMIMENSGVRMAAEELARFGIGQGIPILMLMPFRGDIGDTPSWAQGHGATMVPLLEALQIRYRIMRDVPEVRTMFSRCYATMRASKRSVALVYGIELIKS